MTAATFTARKASLANCDAHLKNWAFIYPDGRTPALSPAYDLVSISAFFADTQPQQYAVNKARDARLKQVSVDDLENLMRRAGICRINYHRAIIRDAIAKSKAHWPEILESAPHGMRASILERLRGGVKLTA